MPASAQLTIAWDGTALRVEGASDANGGRAKIEGILFAELPAELRDWLASRLEQLKDREAAQLRQRQTDNANYIARDLRAPHGQTDSHAAQRPRR